MDFSLARLTTAYFIRSKLTGTGSSISGGTPTMSQSRSAASRSTTGRISARSRHPLSCSRAGCRSRNTELNNILGPIAQTPRPSPTAGSPTCRRRSKNERAAALAKSRPSGQPRKDLGRRYEKKRESGSCPTARSTYAARPAEAAPRFEQQYCLDTVEAFARKIAIMKRRRSPTASAANRGERAGANPNQDGRSAREDAAAGVPSFSACSASQAAAAAERISAPRPLHGKRTAAPARWSDRRRDGPELMDTREQSNTRGLRQTDLPRAAGVSDDD